MKNTQQEQAQDESDTPNQTFSRLCPGGKTALSRELLSLPKTCAVTAWLDPSSLTGVHPDYSRSK
jgi:hypothetical protein